MEHNISKISEQAYALIQELIEKANFNDFLEKGVNWYDWYSDAAKKQCIPDHILITHGCTRMVFWDEDACDYVYKMNIYPNVDDIDYNASEAFVYEKACEEGVGECFAWTAQVINEEKYKVYAMAFCEVDSHTLSNACYSKQFKLYCEDEGYDPDNLTEEQAEEIGCRVDDSDYGDADGMLDYVRDIYDDKLFCKFADFIDKYEIDDLHCGNWGYYQDHLVATDYAGYCTDIIALAKKRAERAVQH